MTSRSARSRAAQQQQRAAQNTGTSASQGGAKGSPSPTKRGPPKTRPSPATDQTRSPSQKKIKVTVAPTADFATVTPILQSETAGVIEFAAENNDVSQSSETAGGIESNDVSQSSSVAKNSDAGKGEAANDDFDSEDSEDDLTKQRRPNMSKTKLDSEDDDDGEDDDDDDEDPIGSEVSLLSPSGKQQPAVAKLARGRQHKLFSPTGDCNQTSII